RRYARPASMPAVVSPQSARQAVEPIAPDGNCEGKLYAQVGTGGGDVSRRTIADRGCRADGADSVPEARPARRGRVERRPAMKYLLLKHYRGGPEPIGDLPPMDRWTPEEVDAHIGFMRDFADRLRDTGEYVDGQALAPDGAF